MAEMHSPQARRRGIPARYAPVLFGLLVSGLMSFMVSGVATLRNEGLTGDFLSSWLAAWWPAWLVAFPVILIVAPAVRRFVARITVPPPG